MKSAGTSWTVRRIRTLLRDELDGEEDKRGKVKKCGGPNKKLFR